jgi:hypothetical protein
VLVNPGLAQPGYVIPDGSQANVQLARNLVLTHTFLEHGKNLRAQLGGMAGERFESLGEFGFLHKSAAKYSLRVLVANIFSA